MSRADAPLQAQATPGGKVRFQTTGVEVEVYRKEVYQQYMSFLKVLRYQDVEEDKVWGGNVLTEADYRSLLALAPVKAAS